jgi:hypothetical protein
MVEELLHLITHFPTVLFTVPLGLAVFYWMLVIFGAADIDVLGGADGALEGAAEGAVEGAAEGAVEGAVEGASEGAAEGAAEAADGAVDGADVGGPTGIKWLFSVLKLRSAPATVVMSLFFLSGWALSALGMHFLPGLLPIPGWATGSLVFAGATTASFFTTSVLIRPVAPLFEHVTHHGHKHLVGQTAVLRMKPTSAGRGQAEVEDGNTGLVINIRWSTAHEFEKGDEALIIDYDDGDDVYVVEPMQKVLGTGSAEKVPELADQYTTKT